MKRAIGVLLVAALAVGVAVWSPWSGGGPPAGEEAASDVLVPAAERRAAPAFEVETTSGERFRLADADRPVVVTFLAVGCPSCGVLVGELAETYSRIGDDGAILLLDVTQISPEEVVEYYRGDLDGAPHLYAEDEGATIARAFEARALGQTYVVDRSGRIAFEAVDPPADELVPAVLQAAREA